MDVVLKVAKQRGLFFVDSFTHSGSVCAKVAKKNGMRIAKRNIFLSLKLLEINGDIGQIQNIAITQILDLITKAEEE